jgi:hypothetical protein
MYGERPGVPLDRLADASAHLSLMAPPAVDALIAEAENLTRSYAPHDERWMADWKEYRSRLRQGFRNELENPTDG